jgi:site-specific DNA-methyltransferase (adenine-specific)
MNNLAVGEIHQGDCLELMERIEDHSIDLVLTDLPYGLTENKWDSRLDLKRFWERMKIVTKIGGAIIMTASQPFTSDLVTSNREGFAHEWIWEKSITTNFLNCKKSPLKEHENILVFKNGSKASYSPIMEPGDPYKTNARTGGACYGKTKAVTTVSDGQRYPKTIIRVDSERGDHPTQKPVALFAYLIRTYSKPGDIVLDCCAGSGTAGVACVETGRRWILIEKEKKYCEIARGRIDRAIPDLF